ncbi:IclR family transcriptional regulator [Natrialbaceae archaeon A-gly3]
MGKTSDSPRRIKSVQTASGLLKTIQHLSNPTFTDLRDEVDITKGTLHTYLETLEAEGFVTKTGDGYRLDFRCLTMGETVRNQTDLYHAGREEVENLAEETGEWAHLTIAYRGQEITVYESSGEHAVGTDYHLRMREDPQYPHYTATGKAMLASVDDNLVERIIDDQELVDKTPQTITDRDELFNELKTVREQGYATNDEEEIRGMRSVGAAIRRDDPDTPGAISVTAPKSRLSGDYFESEIPERVIQAANIIEVNLETAESVGH